MKIANQYNFNNFKEQKSRNFPICLIPMLSLYISPFLAPSISFSLSYLSPLPHNHTSVSITELCITLVDRSTESVRLGSRSPLPAGGVSGVSADEPFVSSSLSLSLFTSSSSSQLPDCDSASLSSLAASYSCASICVCIARGVRRGKGGSKKKAEGYEGGEKRRMRRRRRRRKRRRREDVDLHAHVSEIKKNDVQLLLHSSQLPSLSTLTSTSRHTFTVSPVGRQSGGITSGNTLKELRLLISKSLNQLQQVQ